MDTVKISLPTAKIVLLIYKFRVRDRDLGGCNLTRSRQDRDRRIDLLQAVHHLINVELNSIPTPHNPLPKSQMRFERATATAHLCQKIADLTTV